MTETKKVTRTKSSKIRHRLKLTIIGQLKVQLINRKDIHMSAKKEAFIKEQKQARTVKLSSVVIGILWFASIIAAIGTGVVLRSNFESEVSSRVDHRLEQRELVSKESK